MALDGQMSNRLLLIFSLLLAINIWLYYNDADYFKGVYVSKSPIEDVRVCKNACETSSSPAPSIDFDYTSCPGDFLVYVYPLDELNPTESVVSFHKALNTSSYSSSAAEKACLYVYVTSNANTSVLEHWKEGGRNHLIIFINGSAPPRMQHTRHALFAAAHFEGGYSPSMDMAFFGDVLTPSNNMWDTYPQIFPTNTIQMDISCEGDNTNIIDLPPGLCAPASATTTFKLILTPSSALHFQELFYKTLLSGFIPVLPTTTTTTQQLPFGEFIDWSRAAVMILPSNANANLTAILNSISIAKVAELRRNGRFYLQHYLGDTRVLTRSLLSAVRIRLGRIRAPPEKSIELEVLLTIGTVNDSTMMATDPYNEDVHHLWNGDPTYLDATPLPASSMSTIPLLSGLEQIKGSGIHTLVNMEREPKFIKTLSGNQPEEMFTIVMLAYKRDDQLFYTLKGLNNTQFLHRIIVVWNDIDRAPPPPSKWPSLMNVPILVLRPSHNSLNNRFLPLALIETEAVFHMDDDFDAHIEAILFSFKVWREQRHQIVGVNFRLGYMNSEGKAIYDSTAECSYNMVLTSGAFVHRAYLRSYTYELPPALLSHIDTQINCEDIAINFIVSHLSRRPPIKTTPIVNTVGHFSHKQGLSKRAEHYKERANCIAKFIHLFGYNPLVLSEWRADSVLYNMPHLTTKCIGGT